jgi:hypothetical protein
MMPEFEGPLRENLSVRFELFYARRMRIHTLGDRRALSSGDSRPIRVNRLDTHSDI